MQLSDPILEIIKTDDSLEFISLKEAINLLATKTKSTTFGIATYLLNKKVESTLDCYYRSIDYKLYVSSSANYPLDGWVGDNYAFQWLKYITENEKHLKKFRVSNADKYNNCCEEAFWKRADFFNLECIKSFYLSEEKEWNVLFTKQQYIWDGNYLSAQLSDNSQPLDIDEDQYSSCFFSIENAEYPEKRWIDKPNKQAKKYPLFFKNNTFTPQEVACLVSNYHPNEVGNNWNKVAWLSANPEFEEALDFTFSAVRGRLFEEVDVDLFVISSDELKVFLNSKDIIISGFNDSASANPTNENLFENTQLKNTIANLQLDVAIEQVTVKTLNKEIENLKAELLEKDQKIKELESSYKNTNTNLMNLIFDETATERYAPDLANSIKLWKYLYIDNQEIKGKHSYRANHWIKKNTSYQQEGSIEVKRLREVTSPFDSWHVDRKNKFNK